MIAVFENLNSFDRVPSTKNLPNPIQITSFFAMTGGNEIQTLFWSVILKYLKWEDSVIWKMLLSKVDVALLHSTPSPDSSGNPCENKD